MNARADRARKAATADAFLKNRDRQRKVASKRDMTSHDGNPRNNAIANLRQASWMAGP